MRRVSNLHFMNVAQHIMYQMVFLPAMSKNGCGYIVLCKMNIDSSTYKRFDTCHVSWTVMLEMRREQHATGVEGIHKRTAIYNIYIHPTSTIKFI